MGTPMRSFRLDDETWEKFSNLCKLNYSNSSEQIVKFICSCIANNSVLVDSEMVPKDVLDKRIEEVLNRQIVNGEKPISKSFSNIDFCESKSVVDLNSESDYAVYDKDGNRVRDWSNLEEFIYDTLEPTTSQLLYEDDLDEWYSSKEFLIAKEGNYRGVLDLLKSLQSFCINSVGSEFFSIVHGLIKSVKELECFKKSFSETFSSKDYKSFKGWAKKVDESVEFTKALKDELAELKALVSNLTKPQESEELPYEQRLIYNSERKYEWNGHAFRSEQEVRVAKALDARNVLFSPNMGCRVDENGIRKTREVDFLIIINGRMGVLECDGRSFHKIAADDHERDRNFQRQGIQFIQRYGYDACLDADKVVDDFIKLMKAFYNL